MLLTVISFAFIALLLFLAVNSVEKNPKYRPYWMILGCIMFFTGSISLVVNSVGLTLGSLQWVESMGPFASFLFKMSLIMGGIMIFILVNHNPDAYDEYFDGNKYKE
jgi:hypothetical protein